MQKKLINNLRQNTFESTTLFLVLLLAFLLPISKKPVPITIILLAVFTIILLIKKKSFNKFKLTTIHIGLIALYMLYAIGLIYSENIKAGLFDIEIKMSFLALPLIFAALTQFINRNFYNKILSAFIAGTAINVIYSFARATYNYFQNSKDISEFLYVKLSSAFHPSYFALYLNFAIIILVYKIFANRNSYKLSKKIFLSFLALLFFATIILANSKAGIIIAIISVFILLLQQLFKLKNKLTAISFIVLCALFIIFVWNKVPTVKYRFSVSLAALEKYKLEKPINPEEGTLQRIVIWKHSLNAIKEKPLFGYGTGDLHETLDKKFKEGKFFYGITTHLNCHNQYLQTAVCIGIIGLMVLLFILIALFYQGFKIKETIIILFALIISLHFLFESMLETQAGIIFISFFISLFGILKKAESV